MAHVLTIRSLWHPGALLCYTTLTDHDCVVHTMQLLSWIVDLFYVIINESTRERAVCWPNQTICAKLSFWTDWNQNIMFIWFRLGISELIKKKTNRVKAMDLIIWALNLRQIFARSTVLAEDNCPQGGPQMDKRLVSEEQTNKQQN